MSALTPAARIAIFGWGGMKPGDDHGYPSHTGAVIIEATVASVAFVQLRRALRDLRAQ